MQKDPPWSWNIYRMFIVGTPGEFGFTAANVCREPGLFDVVMKIGLLWETSVLGPFDALPFHRHGSKTGDW